MSLPVSTRLPEFPWDRLAEHRDHAAQHPDGLVDLSVGTPVDPAPPVVRQALADAADAPGYPATVGLPEMRRAAVDWLARRHGVTGLTPDGVLPVVGSKELIGSLPAQLGLGAGDLVVAPELAYPTYEVGAAFAGAELAATDSLTSLGPRTPALLWLNSPANPTGRVLGVEHLRTVVQWCRERGVLLVSDECYLECAFEPDQPPVSVLHPDVCDGSHEGLLTVHSLSKRSNLAGYRCAFVAGDERVVAELLAVRKHLGLIMPGPQQHAMVAALDDDEHVLAQHAVYAARRAQLREALEASGFRVDHSAGALYLWVTRDDDDRDRSDGADCWDLVSWLAERGILVAPGEFYGPAGKRHVRVAFTATDERVVAACARLG